MPAEPGAVVIILEIEGRGLGSGCADQGVPVVGRFDRLHGGGHGVLRDAAGCEGGAYLQTSPAGEPHLVACETRREATLVDKPAAPELVDHLVYVCLAQGFRPQFFRDVVGALFGTRAEVGHAQQRLFGSQRFLFLAHFP